MSASNAKDGNAYGSKTSDTSFRKTWDRDEYAAKAAAREAREKEERQARYDAKMAGHKYVPRASTPPDARATQSRAARLDVASNVGKMTLVPAGAAVGKRGRGAGFYCADCDLTFKDNMQLVEHLNSRQHLVAIGETGNVDRASLDQVRERLAWLKRKQADERRQATLTDLQDRLQDREKDDERRREEKRRKRREKRRKTEGGVGHQTQDPEDNGIIC